MDILALIESCNIEVSEEFLSEFLYIVNSSGSKEQILREFVRYLTLLSKNSLQTLCSENKHFEKLKGCKNLYAIRIIASKCNLRVLFSCRANGKILLHSFEERKGKKATDYRGHIPVALKRLPED